MSLSEFELIERFFASADGGREDVVLGIGDDGAVVTPPADSELVVSVDTLVEGVHFHADAPAHALGYKSLAVNLSDLAAMGATPAWFTLALTLPQSNLDWLADFSRGLGELADRSGIALIGGDTTRGPLSISIQAMGHVPQGQALTRSGARAGDAIYVSGNPGEAAAGLRAVESALNLENPLIRRLYFPQPRLALGQALRGVANAAIDISDGLLADLGHILKQSAVGAELDAEAIPLSAELAEFSGEEALQLALSGGDDYELCFCVPPETEGAVATLATLLGVQLSRIGTITEKPGCLVRDRQGQALDFNEPGYLHF